MQPSISFIIRTIRSLTKYLTYSTSSPQDAYDFFFNFSLGHLRQHTLYNSKICLGKTHLQYTCTLLKCIISNFIFNWLLFNFRSTGLMVSTVYAGLWIERSGFESWPGHCDVFFGKKHYPHSASLHPGVKMGTSGFIAASKTFITALAFD